MLRYPSNIACYKEPKSAINCFAHVAWRIRLRVPTSSRPTSCATLMTICIYFTVAFKLCFAHIAYLYNYMIITKIYQHTARVHTTFLVIRCKLRNESTRSKQWPNVAVKRVTALEAQYFCRNRHHFDSTIHTLNNAQAISPSPGTGRQLETFDDSLSGQ